MAGGRSSEREVSLDTAAVICGALRDGRHETLNVSIDRTGTWSCGGERLWLSPGSGLLDCDVVFPALHGPFGEDGTVQGLLELLDVPYVGAGVLASALCMDKAAFKDALAASGVAQVDYVVARERDWREAPEALRTEIEPLGLPLFIKPVGLGSSLGIVKVTDTERLNQALETAFAHDGVAVVERYSSGVEIECGVIGLDDPETSVPGQVLLEGAGWYDYRAKYTRDGHALVAPARIPAHLSDGVRRLARETFLRVGCAGLARVDFFVEGERILVNEVNTLPSFTPTSDFPRLWQASGIELPALCDRLLEIALERFRVESRLGV